MAKKILIDAAHSEETRVVVADGSQQLDFDFESPYLAQQIIIGNQLIQTLTNKLLLLNFEFLDSCYLT